MAAKAFRHVLMAVHNPQPPTPDDWVKYMAQCREHIASLGSDISRGAILVFSDGGAPNARQRAEIKEISQGKSYPSAIVTESRLVLGVVTILGWVNPAMQAFAPADWKQALAHARVAPGDEAEVWRIARALQAELGELKVLGSLLGPGGPGAAPAQAPAKVG